MRCSLTSLRRSWWAREGRPERSSSPLAQGAATASTRPPALPRRVRRLAGLLAVLCLPLLTSDAIASPTAAPDGYVRTACLDDGGTGGPVRGQERVHKPGQFSCSGWSSTAYTATASAYLAFYNAQATTRRASCWDPATTTTGEYVFRYAATTVAPHWPNGVFVCGTDPVGRVSMTDAQYVAWADQALVTSPNAPPGSTVDPPDEPIVLPPATSCPSAPAAYTGTNETVIELRRLRIEQASACEATRSRLARLETAMTDSNSDIADVEALTRNANTDRRVMATDIADMEALLKAPLDTRLTTDGNQVEIVQRQGDPGVLVRSGDEPLMVEDADPSTTAETVSLSTPDRDAMRRDAASTVYALWLIGGLVVALLVVPPIVRTFWRP